MAKEIFSFLAEPDATADIGGILAIQSTRPRLPPMPLRLTVRRRKRFPTMPDIPSGSRCPYCSVACEPADLFCERCKANLLPEPDEEQERQAEPDKELLARCIDVWQISESEALAIVREEMLAEGRRIEDFHFSVSPYSAGSNNALYLTPWPYENGWCVWVVHDWIHRGLIQAGGSFAFVNGRTGKTHWRPLP
jgi:hypothetical protein